MGEPDVTPGDPATERETRETETETEVEIGDDEFPRWLAACDEQLAAGGDFTSVDQLGAPEELRSRLEREAAWCQSVREMWAVASSLAPGLRNNAPVDPAVLAEPVPVRFGRFEIRRELGRGAFGIVSLAYDPNLHREVALKVPRSEVQVTPELRARFRHEAMAAAGLDHPNIVPVYEAGEEGSVCFIASAYCRGITLSAWLRQRIYPVPCRMAAGLLATLAEAVDHAHARGVLHRDLKPSNVLLEDPSSGGPSGDGADLVPRITDFGMAKLQDPLPGEEGASSRTMTGVIMGTASYMAPEQAEGKAGAVGPAADVYSLGVILYEVLTGRPPFQEDSALETLVQVRTLDPVPPSRLRPRIPRDLETICLKCLNKPPQARYPSAAALADDLRRFLAAEPIHARPTPAWERALKWVHRHPAISALAGAAVVAAVTLAVVIGRDNVRLKRQRDLAESRRLEAFANLRKARDAVDRLLTRVGELQLKDVPQVEPIRRALLEDALEFYRDIAGHAHGDPDVLFEVSMANSRVGRVYAESRRTNDAERCWLEAQAIQQQLASMFPATAIYRRELARSTSDLGSLFITTGRTTEGEASLRKALDLLESLAAADPGEPTYRFLQASAHEILGVAWFNAHRVGDSAPEYRKALDLFDDLTARFPDSADYPRRAALARSNLAGAMMQSGRLEEAEGVLREVVAFWEKQIKSNPNNFNAQSRLALTFGNLSYVLEKRGLLPEAEQTMRRAADVRLVLTKNFPNTPHHFDNLGQFLAALGRFASDRGDITQARRLFDEALASKRKALALAPNDAGCRASTRVVCADLAETLIKLGAHEDAAKTVAELTVLSPTTAEESVRAARVLAQGIPLVAADPKLDAAARAKLTKVYADRSVELIRDAVKSGYRDMQGLVSDQAFDALRSRADFQALIAPVASAPKP
jgi:eukaryotic-like serine/threonine-protein kinase